MEDHTIELRVGNATLRQKLTPVPSNNTSDGSSEWMAYFNVNDTRFGPMVEETARLVAERLKGRRAVIVAPETAPIALVHVLRTKYGLRAQNVGKKKRPHMGPKTIREDYHAVTNTAVNSLYFDGFDEEIGFDSGRDEVVLFDNVVTTGGTFAAAARLLHRFYPDCTISEAVVMFTEGYKPFSEIDCGVCRVPVVALGGHIPIVAEQHISGGKEIRPPQFVFKSSARFPTTYAPHKNILFSVFENDAGLPAIAMVGPGTFDHGAARDAGTGRWEGVTIRIHDACCTSELAHSCKCDCREQLELAMQTICETGGIVVYLFQEGRGIGLANKIRAYYFQTMAGLDTVEANRALGLPDDARSYVAVRDILNHYQIGSVKVMTNNPRKLSELSALGIVVSGRVSAEVSANSPFAARYQFVKSVAMGHLISPKNFEAALSGEGGSRPEVIYFYEPEEEHGWLSNFHPCQIEIHGVLYKSTEHYYQSRKFAQPGSPAAQAARDAVIAAATPAEAFSLSREHAARARPDWELHRKRDMFRGLMAKFKQHSDLREKLVQTGDALLVERSPTDAFWGCGADGKGLNLLGQMLSNIRLALQEYNVDPSNPLIF